MHLVDPVAQAVHHHLQDAGMNQVQSVAAAGVVDVVAAVGLEPVIGRIVDAPEAQGRPHLVALGSMVVDHIQQHLDAGIMQALDHGFEFTQIAAAQITWLRGKEAQGAITPVVAQPTVYQKTVIDEGVNRHQFHRGDAERLKMLDDFRVSQTGAGSTQVVRDALMMDGETAHMGFVNQGARPRCFRRMIAVPVETGIDDHALKHLAGVVAGVKREVSVAVTDLITAMLVAQMEDAVELLGVGIEQQFMMIESVTDVRLIRP